MTNTAIIDKIQRLLRLAESDNVHEAALAAKRAQELMTKHAIEEAMLFENEEDDAVEDQLLHMEKGSRQARWKWALISSLSYVNGCKSYLSRSDGRAATKTIGRPQDVATVRYMYRYLCSEVDRLTHKAAAERGNPGRTWCNNFRMGAASTIGERLRDAHRATLKGYRARGDGAAIVAVDRVEKRLTTAQAWARQNLNLRRGSSSNSRFDASGYAAGKRAGQNVNLNSGPALGRGNERLPS